jgi:hypothetical protein
MTISYERVKTLARLVYELRAEAVAVGSLYGAGYPATARMLEDALRRQAVELELMVTAIVSNTSMRQEARSIIWNLMREGRSQQQE